MKKFVYLLICLSILFIGTACKDDDDGDKAEVIGTITVDLELYWSLIRTQEMPAGNMVTDAIAWYLREQGKELDAAFYNGGSIRFDPEIHADSIIPAGEITDKTIWDELLMFNNEIVIVTVTGAELKEILERSVAVLPDYEIGCFLHVSSDGYYKADKTKTAQIVAGETYEEEIETPGERITSIKFNDVEYHQDSTYNVSLHGWLVDGGDAYVTLRKLTVDKKDFTGIIDAEAVEEYIKVHSPVTPVTEGRIEILP